MIIYMCKFPNNKMYIGKTIYNLETRKNQHKYDMNRDKNNKAFYNAIRKYGWDNLEWGIIDTSDNEEELLEKEIYWIKYYSTYVNFENTMGYNMTLGGDGTSGYKFTKEQKEYLSFINSGENNSFYGKIHSDESKKQMSESKKGMYIGENNPNYNNKWSDKQKQYMSNVNKGRLIGENNPSVVINEEMAKDIKIKLSEGEKTKYIVKELEVTRDVVNNIKNLKCWVDLLPELNELITKNKNKSPLKISIETVMLIKKDLSISNLSVKDLVIKYNVTKDIVNGIKYLKNYKHILPELNTLIR